MVKTSGHLFHIAEGSSGNFFCLDAKLRFDDNAEFRQKAVFDQVNYNCANIMSSAKMLYVIELDFHIINTQPETSYTLKTVARR